MYQSLYSQTLTVDDDAAAELSNREAPPESVNGYAGIDTHDPLLAGYDEHELLQSPKDRFAAYRAMAKGNSTLYTAKTHVQNQLLTLNARVERTEGTREDIAVFLEEQFGLGQFSAGRGSQSIEDIVKSGYLAHLYGFGVWEMEAEFADGKSWLKTLHYRQPDTITSWIVDKSGEWVGAIQRVKGQAALLERGNCMYLVKDRDEGGLTGVGIYRPTFSNWRDSQDAYRQVSVAMQRFASPTPRAVYLPDVAAKFGLTTREHYLAERVEMARMLKLYQSHEEAYLIIPPWWEITEFGGKSSFEPSKILTVASHHERLIGEAFFAAHLQLGRPGGGGTYNLGEMQADVSLLAIVNLADFIFEGLNSQVVAAIVKWNFGDVPAGEMPRIAYTGLKTDAFLAKADALTKLSQAGFLSPDASVDGPLVRAAFGLPQSTKEEADEPQGDTDEE